MAEARPATPTIRRWIPSLSLVTGCFTGFGRELPKQLLEGGYRTVVTARDPKTISALAAFGDALVLKLDVTDPIATVATIDAAHRHFGGIDVLVNNAGVAYLAAIEEGEEAQVRRLFDINFFGLTRLIQAALPGMRQRHSGFIVNKNASKFAVEGLSEALWQEVGPMGIHVMLVEPSGFRTDWAGRSAAESDKLIADYAATAGAGRTELRASSGKQAGDPVRAAQSIIAAVESAHPPHRLLLGAAAYDGAMSKLDEMRVEFREWEAVARAADFNRNANSPVVSALQGVER